MTIFLEMSYLWGCMNYISDRVSPSAVTDLRDLSLLYDFLDAEEWSKIESVVTGIDNDICCTKWVSTSILLITLSALLTV